MSQLLPVVDERLAILVIEDDPVYAEFVAGTLRVAGHEVHHVASGSAAREHVGSHRPDAVILDLVLPDDNGYDLATALRSALPSSAVIILLTADLHPERDRAEGVGIDIVLTKPVEPDLVNGMIELVRARRRRKLAHKP